MYRTKQIERKKNKRVKIKTLIKTNKTDENSVTYLYMYNNNKTFTNILKIYIGIFKISDSYLFSLFLINSR